MVDQTVWSSQPYAITTSFKKEKGDLTVESLIDEQPQRLQLKGVWSVKELNLPLGHQHKATDNEKWPISRMFLSHKLNGKISLLS